MGYDASVAVPEGATVRGNLLQDSLLSVNPRDSGIIRLGVAGNTGMNGNGTVAYVPFRAMGAVGTSTPIQLKVSTGANSKQGRLIVDTIDGSITIVGANGFPKGDCNHDGIVDARDAQCALDMSTKLIAEDLNLDMDNSGAVDAVDATLILQQRSASMLQR
jgi:hypothetical protein